MNAKNKNALSLSLFNTLKKWHEEQIEEGNTPKMSSDESLEVCMAAAAMSVYEAVVDNQQMLIEDGTLEL